MKKVKCEICHKKCTGDALKANNKFYHVECFTCKTCNKLLNEVGFFIFEGNFYCPHDYHAKFGSKCPVCNKFAEGEVVDCLGKTFHQHCFKCSRCRQAFSSNQKITETDRGEFWCQKCVKVPVAHVKSSVDHTRPDSAGEVRPISPPILSSPTACASCNELIHSGQVLLALDTQWHIWCFKCTTCQSVLHGEYMAKDGLPYCVRDYNSQFGVMCYECSEYIAGKVLQAGEYYFHPVCALCTRCGENFEEQEEMFMQGDEIWHSRCNDLKPFERIPYFHLKFSMQDRNCVSSPLVFTRSMPRSPKKGVAYPKYTVDFGKHLTYMYLLPEQNVSSLKHPIGPHPPLTPQYHFPQGNVVKLRRSRISMFKTSLQKLAEVLADQQPRAKSPHMDNEEPIELSQYPGAHVPEPGAVPPIDRDDFPAPPYPYAVEELKIRLSSSDIDEEDAVDGAVDESRIKKAGDELKKFEDESSIAKIMANSLLTENTKRVKAPLHWDPRSASRTPSAKKMPMFKCRYESPINASPSRYLNRPRPWEFWQADRAATATLPYLAAPKPGYSLAQKSATLPGCTSLYYDSTDSPDIQAIGISGVSSRQSYGTLPRSYNQYEVPTHVASQPSSVLRRSLPDMTKPPKPYPYDEIITTNNKMPEDVNRCHLERHLAKDEFEKIFKMMPIEFYKLPEWKRINLKRKAKLY